MNTQQALDKAIAGIITQGVLGQLVRENHMSFCSYYDENTGHKCAVGQLLDDETADNWQKSGVGRIIETNEFQRKAANLQDVDISFLAALQRAHDGAHSLGDFLVDAKSVAQDFKLEFNHGQ